MITIGSDTTTTITATNLDEWKVNSGVTVDTVGTSIDASGAVAGRKFTIMGTLKSAPGPAIQVGDPSLANSQTVIRIENTATVSSNGAGILAYSGGIELTVVGDDVNGISKLITTGVAIDLRQGGNIVMSDGLTESTSGSAILSAGAGDQIKNSNIIAAKATAIVSSGSDLSFETYGTNKITSTEGSGLISTGANLLFKNSGGTITAKLDAISSAGANASIENYATITSTDGAGILATGEGARIVNTVLVSGGAAGISATGAGASIANYGEIRSQGIALHALGDGSTIETTAKVIGNVGLVVGGIDSVAINYNVIRGTSKTEAAVTLSDSADFRHLSGTVSSRSGLAISAGNGDNAVDMRGMVKGDIKLGGGNDWFGAPYGEVKGKVYGGKGDDIYEVGIGVDIIERKGQGNDTIKAMYTWKLGNNIENLELVGNEAADAIGNKLANVLTGNAFANKFWGAGGRDIFVQQAKTGRDMIMDFEDGRDLIDFRGVDGIDGMGDLRGHMREVGNDVLIRVTGDGLNVNLTVLGVELRDLTASDFLF